MANAIYQRASSSGDGYSLSYSLSGPPVLHPNGEGVTAIRKAEQAAVRGAGKQALRKARGAYSPAPIKAGWELHTQTAGGTLGITVANPDPLAEWVEFPTKAHPIVPQTKKALHWGGPGGDVFATRVEHPGTPGKHRLPALLDHLGQAFEAQIARRVTPLLRGDATDLSEE